MNLSDTHAELIQKVFDEAVNTCLENFPVIKEAVVDLIGLVFSLETISKQVTLVVAIETGMMTLNQVSYITQYLVSNISSRSRLIRQLELEQNNTETQDEWMEIAERIDAIQNNDAWRTDPDCPLYERERIAARIDEFVHLMRRQDTFDLMFELRGGIGRNKFGLLHRDLFSKAMAGSKVLIETYHNVVCSTLDFVCDSPVTTHEDYIPTDARLAFFNEMRHAYGRTALLLSGGAALGMYHTGVCKALMLNNLMPRVIGGSSAGSLLAAMIATRTDKEFLDELLNVKGTFAPGHSGQMKMDFFRPLAIPGNSDHKTSLGEVYHNSAGCFQDAKRTWQGFMPIGLRNLTSTIYDIFTGNRRPQDLMKNDTRHFHECVKANVGTFTFQEAFDRTGRILNITVTPTNRSDPPRLLNYLTAPHILVWSGVVASAALPGIFESSRLRVRGADGIERFESAAGLTFKDGSMEQDLPMQQLSEMFNINHFIISQANPHAVMFGSIYQQSSIWANPILGMVGSILLYLKNRLRSWLHDVVELIGTQQINPFFATQRIFNEQVITQEYEGRNCDISLIPWRGHRNLCSAFLHLIYNPSEKEFQEWVKAAERETWKHIPAIKSHIAEEITLDRCVQRLRKRLVVERVERRRVNISEDEKMGERLPSFFTSPSLVNFGGLGISDQTTVKRPTHDSRILSKQPIAAIDINSGWGGQGLRGNRSINSLNRIPSGIFIDEEWKQKPGEDTNADSKSHNFEAMDSVANNSYIKTTSMAHFYYQRNSFKVTKSASESKMAN